MADSLKKRLERWVSAGVVDAGTASRIRTFEESESSGERLRWPVLLAVALGGLLLWHGTQAALLALLVPGGLVGEWEVRTQGFAVSNRLITEALVLIAITYLSVRTSQEDSSTRRALAWIGGLAVLPLSLWAFVEGRGYWGWWQNRPHVSSFLQITGWAIAICGPMALAYVLRKKAAWTNAVAAVWVLVIGTFHARNGNASDKLPIFAWNSLGPYFWAGVGALAMVAWGLVDRRRERINLGVAGFALTVIIFYFSDVMDNLGRSASLIGLGVLFLFGGWALERTRRQLVARVAGGTL